MKIQKKQDFVKQAIMNMNKFSQKPYDEYDDFGKKLYQIAAESTFKAADERLKEIRRYLSAKTFSCDNIVVSKNFKEEFIFAIEHEGTKYFFTLNKHKGNLWCRVEFIENIEEFTADNMYSVRNDFFDARLKSFDDIERTVAYVLNIEQEAVKVDVVTKVVVHKSQDYPWVYTFSIDGKNYLAIIENVSEGNYNIRINYGSFSNAMSISDIKSGKLFKTVLLKRLNDWYKETFSEKARFVWGKNLKMV